MQRCTKHEMFLVNMEELETSDKKILITVTSNFIYNITGKATAGMRKALDGIFEVVKLTAEKLPISRFVLVEPLNRPAGE